MANLNSLLNERISRISRKQIKTDTAGTRRLALQHRRDVAALKRQAQDLTRRLALLESQLRRFTGQDDPEPLDGNLRFSARSAKAQRNRLGLTGKKFAKLVGVSALTIYNWESGKSRPRREQLARFLAVRKLGKRQASERLEKLAG